MLVPIIANLGQHRIKSKEGKIDVVGLLPLLLVEVIGKHLSAAEVHNVDVLVVDPKSKKHVGPGRLVVDVGAPEHFVLVDIFKVLQKLLECLYLCNLHSLYYQIPLRVIQQPDLAVSHQVCYLLVVDLQH